MGHRLTKIYTRTGDAGETGLGDGSRVPKDAPRIAALGDVDELNSCIGVLMSELPADTSTADQSIDMLRDALTSIQHDLFDLGGELSIPGHTSMTEAQPKRLEALVDKFNADLPPLKEFILPGGTRAAAMAHLARTVCRRAERTVIALAKEQPVSDLSRVYLNRLSDLLFVMGRVLNRTGGAPGPDVLWVQGRHR